MREHWLLEQDNFEKVLDNYLVKLKNGKITIPSEILELCQKLFRLADEKLILQSHQEIEDLFVTSLNKMFQLTSLQWENLNDFSFRHIIDEPDSLKSNSHYQVIKKLVVDSNNKQHSNTLSNEAKELINLLSTDFDLFLRTVYQKYNRDYYTYKPIFAYMNILRFEQKIWNLSNKDLTSLLYLFTKNSRPQRILGEHPEDIANLKKIKNLLDTKLHQKKKLTPTIQINLMTALRNEFENAISELNQLNT